MKKKKDESNETTKNSIQNSNEKIKNDKSIQIFFSFFRGILSKIFLILILFPTLIFGKFCFKKVQEIKIKKKHELVFRELQRCAELVTVKTKYSDIISIKKTRIAGFLRSFSIIKYTGIIRGGISDITKSEISISNSGKNIELLIPPVEVLSNDISRIEVFDENRNIFVPISIKDVMDEISFSQKQAFLKKQKNRRYKC